MAEALRNFLSRHLFSPLQGMTSGAWWSLLRRNRFAVDPRYWPRAAFQTAVSLMNEGLARWEDAAHVRTDDAGAVEAPLFILGHFRSGTTHLHNLLALDPQFAFPTLYQTLYPRSYRTTQAFVPRLGAFLLLRTRPHDNVALDFGVPNEDELAICADSGLSPYMGWVFPRHAEFYDRYWTFEAATEDEVARWKSSLARFVAKLTTDYGRPLVLKSPPHTGRIRLLLELFPDARFIHIRRDPYTVFRSTRHMYAATMRFWRLQVPASDDFDDRILRIYRAMYDAFFDQRVLIPEGRSCDIRYEELEADPIGQVGSIYRTLGLAGFASVRPRVEGYIDSIGGGLVGVVAGLMVVSLPSSLVGLIAGMFSGPYVLPQERRRLISLRAASLGTCGGILISAFRHDRARATSGAVPGMITGLLVAAGLVLLLVGAVYLMPRSPTGSDDTDGEDDKDEEVVEGGDGLHLRRS